MSDLDTHLAHYDRLHAEHVQRMAALESAHEDHAERLRLHGVQLAHQRATHRALVEGLARLEALLQAIKDLLERPNGH